MNDEFLKSLKNIKAPAPSVAARERALDAAMTAFDAVHEAERETQSEKNVAAVQGIGWGERLRSITSGWKRNWTMDIRIPLGATFAAILVVPMGWYFMNQTALTPVDLSLPTLSPVETAEKAQEAPVAEMEVADVETRQMERLSMRLALPVPMRSMR